MIPPSDSAAGGLINNLPVHLASTFSKCLYAWEHTSDHCFCVYVTDSYCIYLCFVCHLIVFTNIGLLSAMQYCFQRRLKWTSLKTELAKYKNKNMIAILFSEHMELFLPDRQQLPVWR